jgi:hypothetical protein
MTGAAVVWALAAFVVRGVTDSPRDLVLYPVYIGTAALLVALVVSLLYGRRL